MNTTDPLLISELKNDEGVKYNPYLDTVGIRTVGVGHNIVVKPIPSNWKFPLNESQVDALLADDLEDVFDALDRRMCWWRTLSYARQRVIANMAFNLGIDGLMGFKNTLLAVQEKRWVDASAGMLNSKWAAQVKGRATRLAKMMREG